MFKRFKISAADLLFRGNPRLACGLLPERRSIGKATYSERALLSNLGAFADEIETFDPVPSESTDFTVLGRVSASDRSLASSLRS